MAEALLRAALADHGVGVQSAGTAALASYPADPFAMSVMAEHGYDISKHRAKQATASILKAADLILGLDQTHIDWMAREFPELRGRIHKLGKWSNNADIADPYRQPREVFEKTYIDITANITLWLKRIM